MSHWCDDWFRQKKKREKKRPKLAEIVPPPMRNFLQLVGCAANHLGTEFAQVSHPNTNYSVELYSIIGLIGYKSY